MDRLTISKEPNTRILDINLRGVLFFSRIASVYLRQNLVQGDDKSIIFVSSTAGLLNPAGLPLYSVGYTLARSQCLN